MPEGEGAAGGSGNGDAGGNGGEGAAGQGAGGGNAGQGAPGGGAGQGSGQEDPYKDLSHDELVARIKSANAESMTRRQRIEALEAEKRQREQEGMSDLQKLTAERDELKAENESLKGELAKAGDAKTVNDIATTLRFRNPQRALGLLLSEVKREDLVDDSGKLVDAKVTDALKKLAKSDPYLVETGGGDGGEGRQGQGGAAKSMNDAIRAAAGR